MTNYLIPLPPNEMAPYGAEGHWPFGYVDKVRFHELDPLQHVNNKVYFSWFETIRIRYLDALGLYGTDPTLPRIVVKSVSSDFRREMVLGEDYLVTARTASFRSTSFRMEYAVWAGDLRTTGDAVVVFLEPDGSAKRALPDDLKQRFVEVDGATSN